MELVSRAGLPGVLQPKRGVAVAFLERLVDLAEVRLAQGLERQRLEAEGSTSMVDLSTVPEA